MFIPASADQASLGTAFVYGDSEIPSWALLGEYDNGSAQGKGRTEYIWLPTEDGDAIPIGLYKNGKFFAVHSDHLGTPRLITDEDNQPVWQWAYSAFGNNKPTGVLVADADNGEIRLKATKPRIENNQRFPGQYFDEESNLSYNLNRSYQAGQGRYTQADPIGLAGGLNRFSYVDGNPLGWIDPAGLVGESPVIDPLNWPRLVEPTSRRLPIERSGGGFGQSGGGSGLTGVTGGGGGRSGITPSAGRKGRLGSQSTRVHIDQVSCRLEERGWTITAGGGRKPEEYLPGPGGARQGSSYPDITAEKNGRTLRINTIDTRADGITPTTREARNATRIRAQTGEHLLLIPKP